MYPYYTSKNIKILRYENQPIGKLVFCLNSIGDKIVIRHNSFMKRIKEKIELQRNEPLDKTNNNNLNVFDQMLNLQKEKFTELPLKYEIIHKLKELSSIVSELKTKGVKVVFFEMPINSELTITKRAILLRKELSRVFLHKVEFIPLDTANYLTSDGLHLSSIESVIYTNYLKKEIKSLLD